MSGRRARSPSPRRSRSPPISPPAASSRNQGKSLQGADGRRRRSASPPPARAGDRGRDFRDANDSKDAKESKDAHWNRGGWPGPRPRDRPAESSSSNWEWGRSQATDTDAAAGAGGPPADDAPPAAPKETPNLGLSGALAADLNTFKGVTLKYSEPPESRKPTHRYRLYIFKGPEQIDMLQIHRQSAFLLGRDRLVADIPIDHLSCSKQHAVLQFRQIVSTNPLGHINKTVKPYIIDLDSANGTFVNSEKIPPSRYYELKVGDVIKFGFSSREYVLMVEDLTE